MEQTFDLVQYLNDGVRHFVKGAVKATLKNPKESAFLAQYAAAAKRAEKRRRALEAEGEHVPSFLIASITKECNLNCAGCYDHAGSACEGQAPLSQEEWGRIFAEAEELGVSMILLAGGEPLMRRDVIAQAARHPAIAFPLFTNATMLTEADIRLFDAHRNLVPIISIEGDAAQTDARRGAGVYAKTLDAMRKLDAEGLLFGASITVTKDNLHNVTQEDFVRGLQDKGCKVALFIEYVPVESRHLALEEPQQRELEQQVNILRAGRDEMIIVSFPGDEKEAGGCLAAGRGFFHINAFGGAEPCPFSPYSDMSLRGGSLRQALGSPLFRRLNDEGVIHRPHTGGCVLFEHENKVKQLLVGQ